MSTHVELPGSKRPKNSKATRLGDVNPNEEMEVTIGIRGPNLPDADQVFSKALTQEELSSKYGSSREDAAKVEKALKKFGLKVEEVSLPTRSMRVSGTVGAMEAAFKPKMSIYHAEDQGDYRGREGKIMIPAELKGIVTGIFGLDQRRMARRKARNPATVRASAGSPTPMTPADLESLYNFPTGDGTGQSIAIGEFGGGYFKEDTAAFCAKFGLKGVNVQAISVNAPAYTLDQIMALPPKKRKLELGNSIEVMMDVQIVVGFCPKANIAVYFATFDQKGWVDLLNQVILAKPVTLSISWGLPEDYPGWTSNAIAAVNDRLNAARLLGITICVSSGDDGSGDQMTDGKAHVDFPSSSPYVLSVGGTMMNGPAGPAQEVAWWEAPGRRTANGGGATGGGVSVVFNRPAWQNVNIKSLNQNSIDGRVLPDVAALAGPPLYDLIFMQKPLPDGGTSASAPLWAALIARTNARLAPGKQQRYLTPLLYQNGQNGQAIGQALRDITKGNNASNPMPGVGYKAGISFDAVTGWGVPDGMKLLSALQQV